MRAQRKNKIDESFRVRHRFSKQFGNFNKLKLSAIYLSIGTESFFSKLLLKIYPEDEALSLSMFNHRSMAENTA